MGVMKSVSSRAANRKYMARKHREVRTWLNEYKVARGCADCGFREHPAALEFDHPPGVTKDATTDGGAYQWSWSKERILAVLDLCEVVCANHHAIRTAERGYTGGRGRKRGNERAGVPTPALW